MTNEDINRRYYSKTAASFLREHFHILSDLSDEDLIKKALDLKIDFHEFKRSPARLDRVIKTLGIIRQINPQSLMEAGCGSGVFLWTLLENFPNLDVLAVDKDEQHIKRVKLVSASLPNLNAICLNLEENNFLVPRVVEMVTCLEVLEHIPQWTKAIKNIAGCSSRWIIISFPSRPDKNPEHIHLLDKDRVAAELLKQEGITSTKFDYVLNHTFIIARKE